ncbi:hypothetical protein BDP27DRAFT_1316607 [Rhodocollybia butyracea]|uniref:Uncharacterized protein n=1 Tax=Rhodocollybia butyracea TaxID=206335 RepID=A0A9P5UC00_9AGAR|nr:hypothetical protein BDP27DRAFT_1316607 [Rhodocollybia butyracea]
MASKPDAEVIKVLTQALKDSQTNAMHFKQELDASLKVIEDICQRNSKLEEQKPLRPEQLYIEDGEKDIAKLEVDRLGGVNEKLERELKILNERTIKLEEELDTGNVNKLEQELEAKTENFKQLQEELRAKTENSTDVENTLLTLYEKYIRCKAKKSELHQALKDAQAKWDSIEEKKQEQSIQSHIQIKNRLLQLPNFSSRPHISKLRPFTPDTDLDLLTFLKEAVSNFLTDCSIFHIKGLVAPSSSHQHYFHYVPTSGTISNTGFLVESTKKTYGEIRELFTMGPKGGLIYAGLYKCVSIDDILPGINPIMPLPSGYQRVVPYVAEDARQMMQFGSAQLEDEPLSSGKLKVLVQRGNLKVECVIYQCVGFNHHLYETLSLHPMRGKKQKRKHLVDVDEAGSPSQSPNKRRTQGRDVMRCSAC